MKNYSKMISCLVSIVAMGALWAGPATAQNSGNMQLQSSGLMEKFSSTDVASMLEVFEIEITLQPYQNNDQASLVAVSSGGAQFFIVMQQCDDAANGVGCQQALVFTGMSNAGISYEDLNTFNSYSEVTRAINLAEQQVVMFGTKIFAQGGIGRDNFRLLMYLFLADMQQYVESQQATGNTIALTISPTGDEPSKIISGMSSSIQVPEQIGDMHENALKAAISNTWNVEFLSDEAVKFIE